MGRWVLGVVAWLALALPAYAAPILGTKWGNPTRGTGATISYSFVADGVPQNETSWGNVPGANVGFERFLTGDFRRVVREAFDVWSRAANLTFVEVADGGEVFGAAGSGDIRFWGGYTEEPYLAWTYFPFAAPEAGDLFLNSRFDFVTAGLEGFRLDWILVHEIGHSLGLLHDPFDGSSIMFPNYPSNRGQLNQSDIAAIQLLYGPPLAQVPAPGSLVLLGVGIIGLALRRRSQGMGGQRLVLWTPRRKPRRA